MTPVTAASHTSLLAEAFTDDPFEREPEILAEQSVDARIYRGVAVAQPEKHAEDGGVDAVGTKGAYQVHCEEGKPAENEPADDDTQRLRCLRLHAKPFHLRENLYATTSIRGQLPTSCFLNRTTIKFPTYRGVIKRTNIYYCS